jgi:hypothetical protein
MPSLLRLLTLSTAIVIFPTSAALAFNDTQEYWGNNCIRELNSRKLITGYPDTKSHSHKGRSSSFDAQRFPRRT